MTTRTAVGTATADETAQREGPRIETLEPYVALHARGELGDRPFPDVLGELLGAVWAACEAWGAVTVDAPYAWYVRWDDEAQVIEGGQPIDGASRDRVAPASASTAAEAGRGSSEAGAGAEAMTGAPRLVDVPGGPAAVLWHVGPYETLAESWRRLWGWVGAKGLSAGGAAREEYWTDPGAAPPEEWRTRLVIPLDL